MRVSKHHRRTNLTILTLFPTLPPVKHSATPWSTQGNQRVDASLQLLTTVRVCAFERGGSIPWAFNICLLLLAIGSQWTHDCETAEQAPGPSVPDGDSYGKSFDMLSGHAHSVLT